MQSRHSGDGARRRRQPRFERAGRVDLQRPQRDVGQAEQRLQHLALLGHAQRAVDRAGRLRHDRQVGRSAAAADAAAAAVEQRDRDAVAAARGDDRLLRSVEIPAGGEPADVLGRVGVADHHFLPAADALAIPRRCRAARSRTAPAFCRSRDVSKSGTTRSGAATPRRLLQQLHGQHVRRAARHRDDVGAERAGGHARDHPERVEHVAGPRASASRSAGISGRRLASSRSRNSSRAGFIPVGVRPEPERRGDRRRAPPCAAPRPGGCRVRASVRPKAPTRRSRSVEPAVGDQPLPGRLERLDGTGAARAVRSLGVEVDVGVRLRRRRRARATPRSTRASPAAARAPSRSSSRYGLARVADRCAQFRRRRVERQLVAQRLDLLQIQVRGHPARQQAGLPRDLRRDVRVAVAIAADPRAEADRRRVERQAAARARAQRAIDAAQVARQRVPQALLEHDQAAAHFVERRRPLLRAPRSSPTPSSISRRSAAISSSCSGARQVGAIARRQRRGNAVVLLDQRAARDLGRVRGQHQLDLQRADRLVQPSGVMPAASSRANASSHDPRCGRACGSR